VASSWILFFSYQDGPMHIKLVNNCSEYLLILFYPTSFWSVFMTLTKAGLLACFENSNSIYIYIYIYEERKVNQAEFAIIRNILFVLWNI